MVGLSSSLHPAVYGIIAGAAGAIALFWLLRRRWSISKNIAAPAPAAAAAKGAAGHAGNMEMGGFFYKKEVKNRFENERRLFERLRGSRDPMASCAPEFHGVETIDHPEDGPIRYIKMRSLVEGFDERTLCQMDVKMGVRCFAESELESHEPRKDLYKKMTKIGIPLTRSTLSTDEISQEAITKAKWMTTRDTYSSTIQLGFRVDGVVTPTRRRKPEKDLATCRADSQVCDALRSFLPAERPKQAAEAVLKRLGQIEASLRKSELFWKSELIGSSLLFAADGRGKVGVWMLDFGLTKDADVKAGTLRHDVAWKKGNHEDGYLIGLENLQRLWRKVIADL